MTSYKERILEAIRDSDVGLTTVDVAKHAGVSKTTVIKYLSVLKSEGSVKYVEIGPSKLWRINEAKQAAAESSRIEEEIEADILPVAGVDLEGTAEEGDTVSISFRVRLDQLCAVMKRAKKCVND